MNTSPPSHPLGPLDFAVTVVTALLVAGLVVAVATVFGSGSVGRVGGDEVCATSRPGVVPYGGDGSPGERVRGLRQDSRWHVETVGICVEDPSPRVMAAGALRPAGEFVFILGALFFLRRLVRRARRAGIFTRGVASRTRQLGWLLGLGSLLAAAAGSVSDGLVLTHAFRGVSWTAGFAGYDFPWLFLVVAFGVITVGRTLEWAVVMKDEVDATV